MKSCHEMRPIDQGMGSELAAADPKWGVATRVVAERHLVAATYSTTVVTETIIGLWRPMPCGAGTSTTDKQRARPILKEMELCSVSCYRYD